MNVGTFIRRVQSGFGDYNGIIISEEEIVDWLNEAQSTVIRETQCIKTTISPAPAANTFPIVIVDLYLLDRALYGNAPLEFTSVDSIDLWSLQTVVGTPKTFYTNANKVHLWPTPAATDTTAVTISYVPEATQYTTSTPDNTVIQVPLPFHQDLIIFALARSHEKNENYRAAEVKMNEFNKKISMRAWEIQHGSDGASFIIQDPKDFESLDYGRIL